MTLIVLPAIVVWAVCGAFAYAGHFAYFQRQWPQFAERDYRVDRISGLGMAIAGPIALFVTFVLGNFAHGLKWK